MSDTRSTIPPVIYVIERLGIDPNGREIWNWQSNPAFFNELEKAKTAADNVLRCANGDSRVRVREYRAEGVITEREQTTKIDTVPVDMRK